MVMSVVVRRAGAPILRRVERSNSCPELPSHVSRIPVRSINLMVLHPRAPKIRHLNASHSLLIELDENVKKVQDLENKVIELEKQLQWKEILKKKDFSQAVQKTQEVKEAAAAAKPVLSEEEQVAFRLRLEEAKKKAAEVTLRRDEEEAKILQSWNEEKLRKTVDVLAKQEQGEALKMLPSPQEVDDNCLLLSDIETLVEMANTKPSYKQELSILQEMLNERDSLGKLYNEAQEYEAKARSTILGFRNTITSVQTMRIQLSGSMNMSQTLLNTMKNLETQKKNLNMFVYGPNPIFNTAKDMELSYSINNQFVIEMLKELDLSFHIAKQNLENAQETKRKYKESKVKIMEALHSLQVNIDKQTEQLNNLQSSLEAKDTKNVPVKYESDIQQPTSEYNKQREV